MTQQYEFSFEQMADEAYSILNNKNISKTLVIPNIVTEISTTRLHWVNACETILTINRSHDHFMSWLKKEIPGKDINWFSGDYKDGLIIHGKYQKNKELSTLLLKYINTFVICSSCKSSDSELDKTNRFLCNDCGMSKYM